MAKGNFNDLIKEDPELAAGILQNSFIHVVNNMIPNIYLSKEEYKQLVGIILAGKAKDPDEVENTDEEGDDNKTDPPETPGTGEDPEKKEPSSGEDPSKGDGEEGTP